MAEKDERDLRPDLGPDQDAKTQGDAEPEAAHGDLHGLDTFPVALPAAPDLAGRKDQQPSGRRFCWLIVGLVVAFFLGQWLARHGYMWQGVALMVVAVCLVAASVAASLECIIRFLLPRQGDVLTPEERAALEKDPESDLGRQGRRVLQVGGMLGRPESAQPAGSAAVLPEQDVMVLDAHRARETHATLDWLGDAQQPVAVSIAAADESTLVGHVFECAPGSNRWVILAHDFSGSWTDCVAHVRRYAEHGFNVLIPELRAHHQSGGTYVGLGFLDSMDLVLWSRWIVQFRNEGARIVLHGMGMGASAVCMAAAEKTLPSGVVVAVSDSAYSDVWNVALRLLRASHVPSLLVMDVARLIFRLRPGGYDLALCSPAKAVVHAQVPMLYLQGEEDLLTPAYMGKKIYDATSGSAAGDNKRLCMFRHAGHCSACFADPARYYHVLFAFVEPRC